MPITLKFQNLILNPLALPQKFLANIISMAAYSFDEHSPITAPRPHSLALVQDKTQLNLSISVSDIHVQNLFNSLDITLNPVGWLFITRLFANNLVPSSPAYTYFADQIQRSLKVINNLLSVLCQTHFPDRKPIVCKSLTFKRLQNNQKYRVNIVSPYIPKGYKNWGILGDFSPILRFSNPLIYLDLYENPVEVVKIFKNGVLTSKTKPV